MLAARGRPSDTLAIIVVFTILCERETRESSTLRESLREPSQIDPALEGNGWIGERS